MTPKPKRAAESATEMVQVVLPNDANALGFILGGTVMHLIDIAGAIACHRHTRSLLVTAAVDGLPSRASPHASMADSRILDTIAIHPSSQRILNSLARLLSPIAFW